MENMLGKLFEHNTWANLKMLEACSTLSPEQLDAQPLAGTKGSIRRTLEHLVFSEAAYVAYLTGQKRPALLADASFDVFLESAQRSGQALLGLAQNIPSSRIQTKDGYQVEPWVLYVQIINHATEHREQISSMLTALGGYAAQPGWLELRGSNKCAHPAGKHRNGKLNLITKDARETHLRYGISKASFLFVSNPSSSSILPNVSRDTATNVRNRYSIKEYARVFLILAFARFCS